MGRRFEMLVAVPLFGDEVSPRFGYTAEVMLAEVDAGKVVSLRRLAVPGQGGRQVYSLLVSLRPAVVICGGIHRSWQQMLQHERIAVVWGVIGIAEDAVKSYAMGRLKSNQFVCPGRRAGRGSRAGRGRGQRGRRNRKV
jgi:predicted Fe-Mo cluster-binding NifX family protein